MFLEEQCVTEIIELYYIGGEASRHVVAFFTGQTRDFPAKLRNHFLAMGDGWIDKGLSTAKHLALSNKV